MVRYIVLFFILLNPVASSARTGWFFSHYSLIAGQEFQPSHLPLLNAEFRYDRFGRSCLNYNHYRGVGINYSFNTSETAYGLTGIFNPIRYLLVLNRRTKFYPYLFGKVSFRQLNYSSDHPMVTKRADEYFFQPGLGFTGNFREDTAVPIKLFVQLGYQTSLRSKTLYSESWIAGVGIGFGLDVHRLRKVKTKSQSENGNEN